MVDLACLLAAKPRVLLLDEPSTGLAQAETEMLGPLIGRIVKETGDGLLLWFPEPRAALLSALEFQDGFRAQEARTELPLWVRIGMHWGSQTRRGDDLIGHDVNVAARVVDVAGPAEIVVTEALVARLGEADLGVAIDELGPVVMKGLPDPVRLFRVEVL